MAAALECWSRRTSTDEDTTQEQTVLMQTHQNRSESQSQTPKESSAMQKKLQKLSRNVSEAINSLKNSLNLDSVTIQSGNNSNNQSSMESCRRVVWGGVLRNLTQLYPGSQLPERLVSNIRKHFDSLPLNYAQAGFEMKDVFLHIRMIEQASIDEGPSITIQEVSNEEVQGSIFKLTFVCNSAISWPAMSGALDTASICCKKIQIFEKKGFTLGVVLLLVQAGQEKSFKIRIENALKSAVKKPKSATAKLSFGLCGCQEDFNTKGREMGEIEEDSIGEQNCTIGIDNLIPVPLQMPLPDSSFLVSVDEWQTVQSGCDEIGHWLLSSDNLEFIDQIKPNLFRGVYKGKRVGIEKHRGCDKGNSYEFELRRDLLDLMTCGHKNIMQFHGVCIDDIHGLCVVTKSMEGGAVHAVMMKNKKFQTKEIIRIACDVAEGLKFMNDHGVPFRDLNTQRILLDRHGNACLGDMGIITACKSAGDAMEYETDGYQWLAPEIIAGDPESVTETWMSNVYSYGMVIWEMVTGEAAYSAYSPVQAAVGIAACGLRPDIPKDCPQLLKCLMTKCWNSCPAKRPMFFEILSILTRTNNSTNTNR